MWEVADEPEDGFADDRLALFGFGFGFESGDFLGAGFEGSLGLGVEVGDELLAGVGRLGLQGGEGEEGEQGRFHSREFSIHTKWQ
jgi:hypothetical protein